MGLLEVEDAEPGTPPIITRSVDSTGSSTVGGNEAYASSWSGGVSAGSLVPPENWGYVVDGNNPLPPGGRLGGNGGGKPGSDDGYGDALRDNWGEGGGGELPPSPLGGFEGSGMAVAVSASGSLNAGGEVTGSWNMNGILHDDKWESLVGSALDAFNASTSSSGDDSGLIVLRDSGVEEKDKETIHWDWTLGYSSGANGGDGASIGGSVTTELSPTDEGLAEVDYTDAWVRLAADADGDVKTIFTLRIGQAYAEDLSKPPESPEPNGDVDVVRSETNGRRFGNGVLNFQYGISGNYEGDGYTEIVDANALPTAEANLLWEGTQADFISLDSFDEYYLIQDEYNDLDNIIHFIHTDSSQTFLVELGNLVTTDGDLTGAFSLVPDSTGGGDDDGEIDAIDGNSPTSEGELVLQAIWSGEGGDKAASKTKYHATLESNGVEWSELNSDGLWLYDADEDRDATFDLLAIEQQSFDPETGAYGEVTLTLIGDEEVQITGTDLYDQPWEPNELELALMGWEEYDYDYEPEGSDGGQSQYNGDNGFDETSIWNIPLQFVGGIAQGGLNIVNGLQDTVTGVGNLVISIPNGTATVIYWAGGIDESQQLKIPYIPFSDWSRDMVVYESDASHNVSKYVGAAGVEIASGVWLAHVSKLRALALGAEEAGSVASAGSASVEVSLVDDLVLTSLRPAREGSRIPRAIQSLQKKIDRGSTHFGQDKTSEAAERIIREIMEDAQTAITRPNGVDIRDSLGRGVRITDGLFDTFLEPGALH